MNILIVEDDFLIARSLRKICQSIHFVNSVDVVLSYDDALRKVADLGYDLFLTDLFLGVDQDEGLKLCEFLRLHHQRTPIIIVTSYYSIEYLERAFALGVNDYLLKPFHPKEIELRIQRWMKVNDHPIIGRLQYEQLSYEPTTHEFFFEEKKLSLTKREKALLIILLRDSEKLLPTHFIEEKFWGDYSHQSHNIRSNIQSLRRSLGSSCGSWIQTVRGEGYILKKVSG